MNSLITKGILFLIFTLTVIRLSAQPPHYEFISATTTDTLWASRTDMNGHTSDYYLYCWCYIKSWKYDRQKHALKAYADCDGHRSSSAYFITNSLRTTPVTVGIGASIKNKLTIWLYEKDWNDYAGVPTLVKDLNRLTKSFDTTCNATIYPPSNLKIENSGKDYTLILKWDQGTDIPETEHKYQILRDGILIGTTTGNKRIYTDAPSPGTHLYEVKTLWQRDGIELLSVSAKAPASTFSLDFKGAPDTHGCISFKWNPLTNVKGKNDLANIGSFTIIRQDTITGSPQVTVADQMASDRHDYYNNTETNLTPGFHYRYILIPKPITDFYPDTTYAAILPNGSFSGTVTSLSGIGVPGVEVCAIRLDTIPQQDASERYCDITDSHGMFAIEQVYYYLGSDFTLRPSYKNHGFKLKENPMYTENKFRLDQGNFGPEKITFVDTTSLVIRGSVIQPVLHESCNLSLKNIKVKLYKDKTLVSQALTDPTGSFSFAIDSGDEFTFVPEFYNHYFTPDSFSLTILSDTVLNPIIDTTRYKLSGYVYGACHTYFGKARVKIFNGESEEESCINTTISTNNQGYYEILLPAGIYTISVESFSSVNNIENQDVVDYFTSRRIDLTRDNVDNNFVYRTEPRLEITGLDKTDCLGNTYPPVLKQDHNYALSIQVLDRFDGETCPADTGFVNIVDLTGYKKIDTILVLVNGKAKYYFKPGFPNLISNYQKHIEFIASVEKEEVVDSMNVIVEGAQPLENSFVTTSPEIPLFILHDPPGDNSYAYLQKDSTTNITVGNIKREVRNQDGFSNELKFCPTYVFSYEFINWEFSTSLGWTRTKTVNNDSVKNKQSETIIEMTHKQGYQTSSDPALTASTGGDVFIGGALNLIYAETKEIYFDYNTCQVKNDFDLYMLPHSLATDFVYSENQIRNYLIPELDRLQRYFEDQESDSAIFFMDQKNIWLTALANNQKNLSDNSAFKKRISFDGGTGPIMDETTGINTLKNTYEFHATFDTSVMLYFKAEIAGVGLGRNDILGKIQIETGKDTSFTSTTAKTTGFVLKDDDPGDKFMVDVFSDNVYGTPAFKLVSGNSSCPHEINTRPREGVQLTSNKYVATVDDPDGTAVFRLQMANTSQTNESRDYNLIFHQGSNPDGAKITLGGSQIQAGVPIPYTINPWGINEATVTVERGPEAFDYNNLMFTLESGCDDSQIADTLLLDAHFKGVCSNLFMNKPAENWVISSADEGKLRTTLGGYDRDLLNDITLQICPENDYDNWYSLEYLSSGDLDPEQTDVDLFLNDLEDGKYELRARLECNSGKIYTQPIKGIKDSHGPAYFGVPEPADNILDSGDKISVLFNEPINAKAFSSANILCMNMKDNSQLICAGGCNGNEITIYPEFPSDINSDDIFRVFVFGLEDSYGNKMDDTVSWEFTINEIPVIGENDDTDWDKILNYADNCMFTSNGMQEDTDHDGIGDACDADIDDDGVSNMEDNCQYNKNTGQEDLDGDHIGDACDFDDDGDMIPDTIDNDPRVYNPNQVISSLNDVSDNFNVALHPNPVADILYVGFTEKLAVRIEIHNMIGECIYNTRDISVPETEINVTGLIPGVYLVQVVKKSGFSITKKFIKI